MDRVACMCAGKNCLALADAEFRDGHCHFAFSLRLVTVITDLLVRAVRDAGRLGPGRKGRKVTINSCFAGAAAIFNDGRCQGWAGSVALCEETPQVLVDKFDDRRARVTCWTTRQEAAHPSRKGHTWRATRRQQTTARAQLRRAPSRDRTLAFDACQERQQ